jgi:hypothetical protein
LVDFADRVPNPREWQPTRDDAALRFGAAPDGSGVDFARIERAFLKALGQDVLLDSQSIARTQHEQRNFERAMDLLAKAGIVDRVEKVADQIVLALGAKELAWLSVIPGAKGVADAVAAEQSVYLVAKDGAPIVPLPLGALQAGTLAVDLRMVETPKNPDSPSMGGRAQSI